MKRSTMAIFGALLAMIFTAVIGYIFIIQASPKTTRPTQAENKNATAENKDSLSELIILNNLFEANQSDKNDLARLMVIAKILDDDNNENIDLAELIVLNNLFGDPTNTAEDLAKLIAVDRLIK